MLCSVLPASQANAAVKHKGVYSTLKNGVLTISGKGKMPKNMKFRGNTKIKKVIIKKVLLLFRIMHLNYAKIKECFHSKHCKIRRFLQFL